MVQTQFLKILGKKKKQWEKTKQKQANENIDHLQYDGYDEEMSLKQNSSYKNVHEIWWMAVMVTTIAPKVYHANTITLNTILYKRQNEVTLCVIFRISFCTAMKGRPQLEDPRLLFHLASLVKTVNFN